MEHPFGTIKRQWGFDHIMTKKGIKRASADVGLIMIAYNPKRILNIIEKEEFKRLINSLIGSSLSIRAVLTSYFNLIQLTKHTFKACYLTLQLTNKYSIFTL